MSVSLDDFEAASPKLEVGNWPSVRLGLKMTVLLCNTGTCTLPHCMA